MSDADAKRCLLLGGYGYAGRLMAERTLAYIPGTVVIIAGRSGEKAAALAGSLDERFPGRATAARLDAGVPESLEGAPAFDVLVNLTQVLTLEYITTLMKFADSRGAAYLDIHGAHEDGIGEVARIVGPTKAPMLTSGGVLPGFAAPFIRLGATLIPRPTGVHVCCVGTLPPSQAWDVFDNILCKPNYRIFTAGGWRALTITSRGAVVRKDLGEGVVDTTAAYYEETESLPAELGLAECSVRAGGVPGAAFELRAWYLAFMVFGRRMRGSLIRWLERIMGIWWERHGEKAFVTIEAVGNDASGARCEANLHITEPQGVYALTCDCATAQLAQIVDETIRGDQPPVLAGCATDPSKALAMLREMGCIMTGGAGPDGRTAS